MASEQEKRLKNVQIRSRERALQEERLGLAAIAKAFVMECPDPGRLLARLEAMSRAAQKKDGVPLRVRGALIDGTLLVKNAINRELGKPQELLDPPGWNHVKPEKVNELVPTEDTNLNQLGLIEGSGELGDVIRAHEEQVKTISGSHEGIVRVLKQEPATDKELWDRYMRLPNAPRQSFDALKERRRELCLTGRVVSAGVKRGKDTVYMLVEDITGPEGGKKIWGKEGRREEKVQCPECAEAGTEAYFGKGAGLATHRQAQHGLARPRRINAPSSAR